MDASKQKLVDERILVLNGVGLVEIAGKVYVGMFIVSGSAVIFTARAVVDDLARVLTGHYIVAPGTLVDAIGGVPHTWTACPPGVKLPDGSVSKGTFTMVSCN